MIKPTFYIALSALCTLYAGAIGAAFVSNGHPIDAVTAGFCLVCAIVNIWIAIVRKRGAR